MMIEGAAMPGQDVARPDMPVAVVIGAGGLGMAVARRLGHSYRLLLADRDEAHVEGRAGVLREEGHDVTPWPCDVSNAAMVERLAKRAVAQGPVRAVAHVVGLSTAANDFDAILAVNFVGAALVERHFLPHMARGGAAVFISSSSAHMGALEERLVPWLDDPLDPDFLPSLRAELARDATPAMAYMLSKMALNRLCRRRAGAWGRHGARIVSLSPGLIATPMGADAYKTNPGKFRLLESVPLAREGAMPEIANVVDFLLSAQASFLSGTDILVDGGMIAALQFPDG